ncbi:hypothetical protein TRFO_17829 [Tritrichomonas foetus]|uniref:Uncharacterized protein n=1 Tax=Tritrichomonas foetus TaxID=1144522 RepID=A0A1J4KM27_9EUKA|nr:hypothetical protein TRFO_17829 [Tritrichomonas foetus]|eukprot:OHT12353.1 hypothetical protein TRFO_17829 [Tritrichomonas foetus]
MEGQESFPSQENSTDLTMYAHSVDSMTNFPPSDRDEMNIFFNNYSSNFDPDIIPRESPLSFKNLSNSLTSLPDSKILPEAKCRQSLPNISMKRLSVIYSPPPNQDRPNSSNNASKINSSDIKSEKNEKMNDHSSVEDGSPASKSSENKNIQHVVPMDHIDPKLYLDLTGFTQGYDSEQGSGRIPPRLARIVTQPKDSVFYLALCGVDISGYNKGTIRETVVELKRYLSICVEKRYIAECAYLEDIIDSIQFEGKLLQKLDDAPIIGQTEDQLDEAVTNFEEKETQWRNLMTKLDAEEKITLDDLESKFKIDCENLEIEWSSHSKLKQFNKPSKNLMELRSVARNLMKTRRFNESVKMLEIIAKREKEDGIRASQKMQEAYNVAQQNLEKQYRNEVENTKIAFQKKRNAIEKKKSISLLSYNRRVDKLEKTLDMQIENTKTIERTIKKEVKAPNRTVFSNAYIKKGNNLILPPIMPITRKTLPNSRPTSSMKKGNHPNRRNTQLSRPSSKMGMRGSSSGYSNI